MGWACKGASSSGTTAGVAANLWGREAWQVDESG